MATIITPYILKQIKGSRFKGDTREKQELIKKIGQSGISHFQMGRELEELGYKKEDRQRLIKMMCDLADERKQKNIKASRRLSKVFGLNSDENNQTTYAQRKFANQGEENKRDIALKKIRGGGSASAKNDMRFLGKKPGTSALSSGKDQKVGFAGKSEEKTTGFAGQLNKPSNLTKGGEPGVTSGIGPSSGGSGPMRL